MYKRQAIVRLADEVINAAPPTDLPIYAEPVSIPANPTAVDQSQTEAVGTSPITDSESGNAAAYPPEDNQDKDTITEATQPVPQVFVPARPNPSAAEQRSTVNRRREPQVRPTVPAGQATLPPSYLYRPQETVPPVVNTLVEPLIEPEVQPLSEPTAAPTETLPPATESYGLPFKGSLWRTLGMGILITAGLAILIRAMSGED